MGNCDMVFVVVKISVIALYLSFQPVSSVDSAKSLNKLLIQSSNNETFSFTTLSTHDHEEDTNETWRARGFQVENVSSLITAYPLLTSASLPLKNSSRFFSSKNASASLTILIKSFQHEVLFLNFSYFIGKIGETSESPVAQLVQINNTIVNQKLNGATSLVSTTKTEATSNQNTSQSLLSTNTDSVITPNFTAPGNIQTLVPELNQTTVSISMISSLKDGKSQESTPIKFRIQQKRKRRSVILESMLLNATSPPSTASDGDLNVIKQTSISMATDKDAKLKWDENKPTISAPRIIIPNSNNVTTGPNPIDSLTLVQAVEMIKTAAAAISKSSIISTNSVPSFSVTVADTVNNSSNYYTSTSTAATVTSNDLLITATEKSEPISSSTTAPKLKETLNDIGGDIKTTTEITHRNHHKSKNGSKKKDKKKGKGKKVDNVVERNEDDSNDQNSSSSSEENTDEHEEEKPKISYKMWRASLEKKNRPPGLYVTVNDDIIFDNWEGIWDKHYVLGKWTGSKTLDNEKWNHTSLFLNWDSVSAGHDLKITFEWEPVVENYELILSDIEISTMVSPTDFSCTTPTAWGNDESYKETDKERYGQMRKTDNYEKLLSLSPTQVANESEASIVVLQQTKTGWELVRVGKSEQSIMGKINELNLHQLSENNQKVKLEKREINSEDILQKILQGLRNNTYINATTQNTISTITSIDSTTPPSLEKTTANSNDQAAKMENITITTSSTNETINVSLSNVTNATIAPPTNSSPQETSTISITSSSTSLSPTISTSATSSSSTTTMTTTTTTTEATESPITNPVIPITTRSSDLSATDAAAAPNNKKETSSTAKKASRKTDTETALVVSLLTGSIALVILIVTVKKRIDISIKGRNAVR